MNDRCCCTVSIWDPKLLFTILIVLLYQDYFTKNLQSILETHELGKVLKNILSQLMYWWKKYECLKLAVFRLVSNKLTFSAFSRKNYMKTSFLFFWILIKCVVLASLKIWDFTVNHKFCYQGVSIWDLSQSEIHYSTL